jgi:NAD(P)-dependent dehydrogenase (short-subunit alcohol dehydrogenase family)
VVSQEAQQRRPSGIVEGLAGVVTGAAGGIGRSTAVRFAEEGANVVVNDVEAQRTGAEETVALVEAAGGRAVFVPGDVGDAGVQRALVDRCVAEFGALDFAHNNAAVAINASVEDAEEDDWDAMMRVNLKGVWLGMKHQLAQMRRQGHGAIVNTASSAGLLPMPGLAGYTASKFGVVGVTKAAAIEVGEIGIRVNCVCPSAVRTPLLATVPEEHHAVLYGTNAIKRLSEPEEVAEAVVWLASPRASLVTGVALPIDLGSTAGFAR